MISKHYTMTFPNVGSNGYDRIKVIRAIRTLTGWGLKEAKDVTERHGTQRVHVQVSETHSTCDNRVLSAKETFDTAISELQRNGVIVVETARSGVLAEVRVLASEALLNDDLDLAIALIDVVKRFN